MQEKLYTTQQLQSLCSEFGIQDFNLVKALIMVESSNTGFDPKTKLIKIQFEPAYFKKFTGKKILNGVEGQAKEWEAFNAASAMDDEKAKLSTSWGLGQIMGDSHKLAGYDSVDKMIAEFKLNEFYQIKGMLNFMKNKSDLLPALKAKRWKRVALLFNGPAYDKADPPYDERIEKSYNKLPKYA